jgi:hypothetical protein
MEIDRIWMSQRERDVLKCLSAVIRGELTQVQAGLLIKRSQRQVQRMIRRLESDGDRSVIHRLRGRPSNNRADPDRRKRVLRLYQKKYAGFGPTLASEKLAQDDQLPMSPETLRGWLMAEGLWSRKRDRDKHRQRRVRRSCFGEMVQADASEHDWLQGRDGSQGRDANRSAESSGKKSSGSLLTLVGMIDDATDRVMLRFYPSETTGAYMDLLGRWIGQHGRPVSWYSDRHSIFRAEEKVAGYDQKQSVPTQFSRATAELGMELILANSPQAKGRIERLWGTCQNRLVNELRLAKASTIDQANAVLQRFVAWFNRRCRNEPASAADVHRPIDKLDLEAILSIQHERVVHNDYTIRLANRVYQILPPALPGLRKAKVMVEERADGSMRLRFKGRYLKFEEVKAESPGTEASLEGPKPQAGAKTLGLCPKPRSLAHGLIPVMGAWTGSCKANGPIESSTGPITVHQADKRSGRTPTLPCPLADGEVVSPKQRYRPPPSHPWRNGPQR